MIAVLVVLPLIIWFLFHVQRGARFQFNNRVIVITGGANGIGKQLASTILKHAQQATIVLLDIDEQALVQAKMEFQKMSNEPANEKSGNASILTYVCDVSNERWNVE